MRVAALAGKRGFNWAWRAAVTLAVVAWISSQLDLAQLTRVFIAPRWDALALMVLSAIVFAALGGVKVWVLVRAFSRVRLRVVVAYFFLATAFGSFTPASLGDFSIAALLQREKVPMHQGLSAMLVDRVISVATYVLFFTPLTLIVLLPQLQLWWFPVIFLIVAALGLILNANRSVRQYVRTRLIHAYFPALEEFARTISDLLRLYPLHLVGNVALTLVRSIVAGLVIQFALVAAQEQPPLFPVICATNFLTIVNLFPISIGGLGVYEASGVVLFEQIGLNGEKVLAALFYQRAYIFLSSGLILLTYWVVKLWHSRPAVVRQP